MYILITAQFASTHRSLILPAEGKDEFFVKKEKKTKTNFNQPFLIPLPVLHKAEIAWLFGIMENLKRRALWFCDHGVEAWLQVFKELVYVLGCDDDGHVKAGAMEDLGGLCLSGHDLLRFEK